MAFFDQILHCLESDRLQKRLNDKTSCSETCLRVAQPNRSPIYWIAIAGNINWHGQEFSPTIALGAESWDGELAVEKRRSSATAGDTSAVG